MDQIFYTLFNFYTRWVTLSFISIYRLIVPISTTCVSSSIAFAKGFTVACARLSKPEMALPLHVHAYSSDSTNSWQTMLSMTTFFHPLGSLQKGYPTPLYSPWFRLPLNQQVGNRLLQAGQVCNVFNWLPGDDILTSNPATILQGFLPDHAQPSIPISFISPAEAPLTTLCNEF